MSEKERACKLIKEGKFSEASDILNLLLNESEIAETDERYEIFYFLGVIALENKHFALAKALFEKSLSLNPSSACVNNNLGVCYKSLGFVVESRKYFEEAIRLFSTSSATNKDEFHKGLAVYMANYGSVYAAHGDPGKSISISKTALQLADTYNNAVAQSGKTDEEKKQELSRTNWRAYWNIALASLEMGNYEQGFKLYDAGFDVELGLLKLRHYPKIPLWKGEKVDTLLVYGDQGIGDEIMYASIIPELMKTCHVILECHPRLESLFKSSFKGIPVYPTRKDEINPEWTKEHKIDAAISMCQLAKFFRKTEKDFPGTPYIAPEKCLDKDADIKDKLKTLKKKVRVGISWAGGIVETGKKYRNIELKKLKPLFDIADIDFISLQYTKEAADDVAQFKKDTGITIHHWQGIVDDYDKTASLLTNLDLVISVPQSVIHLAGAIGVKTLQLCPKYSMWQCGKHGENAPWYRSVTNIWQDVPYEWECVIEKTREILCSLSAKNTES